MRDRAFVASSATDVAGQLTRAAVELAKLWRTDKFLRKLDVRPTCFLELTGIASPCC